MNELKRTVFYDQHKALGAKIVEFGGWEMPIQYPSGIVEEHLATRKGAGLFDVSHMGRFIVRGSGAVRFLQHVLTNNVAALDLRETGAQYTLIPNETGGLLTMRICIISSRGSIFWWSMQQTGRKTGSIYNHSSGPSVTLS